MIRFRHKQDRCIKIVLSLGSYTLRVQKIKLCLNIGKSTLKTDETMLKHRYKYAKNR